MKHIFSVVLNIVISLWGTVSLSILQGITLSLAGAKARDN
jgi:hypothetical protein